LAGRGHEVAIITPRKAIDAEISTRLSPAVKVCESALTLRPRARLIYQARLSISMARVVPASDVVVATHTPTLVPTLMATFGNSQRRL
jgi:hypothetical protein